MHNFPHPNSSQFARVTGVAYLTIAVAGGFSIGYVPEVLFVKGDTVATLANIKGNMGLFKLGIGADALVMLVEVIASSLLFFMFKPVNQVVATGALIARLFMVSVMAAMLFFHAGILSLIDPAAQTIAEPTRLALAQTFLHMHHAGVWIWQVFFFLHLWMLGRLVAWSGRFPKLLGHMLSLGALGYLLDSLYAFAFPAYDLLGTVRIGFLVIVTLAEVGFALWLAIKAPAAPQNNA